MASTSQHRCVFVGNIPYDATEEQLVQICEEVGPVVSFRLVLDRETGKPKGYGFCEYKDEETALSARRNLQGYEINGRQLRVDFAENDKGTDRNREQGRGGPGLIPNIDAQRTSSGPPILGNSSIQQPIGLPIAANAASVMAGALGGVQASNMPIQNPSGHGADPLTLHLAKMSRNQLHDIMSEMKALIARDKPLALRVLQMCPQFLKALFQSQIMLGIVPQQMLQMPHIHQSGSSVMKPQISSDGQSVTVPHTAQLPALQNAAQLGIYPRPQDGRMSMLPQNPLIPQQSTIQPRNQPLSNSIQPPTVPVTKGIVPVQPPLTQQPRPVVSPNLGHQHHSLSAFANTSTQQPALPRPPPSQNGSSSYAMNISRLEGVSTEAVSSASLGYDSIQGSRPNLAMTSLEQVVKVNDVHESTIHPSKLARMEDGSHAPQILSCGAHAASSIPAQGSVSGLGLTGQVANIDGLHSEKQTTQFLPEAEAALLQQVMSLTAEQLNSLPQEQRQQVIQLQQMLRS